MTVAEAQLDMRTGLMGGFMFYALAAVLVAAGVVLALYVEMPFPAGAWVTAVALLVFAFLGRARVASEIAAASPAVQAG